MSRGLSATLKSELAKSNFAWALLAKLEFNSTYYFTTAQHDLSSGGNTYLSSGMLLDLSEISEDSGISTGGITVTLSAAATSLMTDLLANGHLHRQVTVSLALLDSANAIIDSPAEIYRGRVESMSIKDSAKSSLLEIGVANHWADFERSNGRSMTSNSQQQKFAGDKGFEFANQAGDSLTWGDHYYWTRPPGVAYLMSPGYQEPTSGWRSPQITSEQIKISIMKLKLLYGVHQLPGVLIYQEVSENQRFLYQCYAICEGPVKSIVASVDPPQTADQLNYVDSYIALGDTTTKTFPSWMTDAPSGTNHAGETISWGGGGSPAWSAAHQLKGVAFAFFRTENRRGIFGDFPQHGFAVEGILLTGSDKNPALILKDFLTSATYGCNIPAGDLDNDSFTAAATICDQTNDGHTRHECSTILDTDQPLLTTVRTILASCNGQLHWLNGKYRLHISDTFSATPAFAFDATTLLSDLEIQGESKQDRATQVVSNWVNGTRNDEVAWPDQNNESSIYAAHFAADNDVELKKSINLVGVTNYHQARYLAKQHCLRSRNALRCSFSATAEALEVIAGDVITITHATPAWTAKEFRVESVKIGADLSIGIEAVEHQDSHYTWDSITAPVDAPDTNRPDPTSVTAPTNLVVSESLYSTREGAGLKVKAVITWTGSTGGNVDQYSVEYKLSTASSYTVQLISPYVATLDIIDIDPGAYDFRVAAVNEIGSFSSYTSVSFTIEGLPALPATPTTFRINSLGTLALAQWDLSPDLDVRQGGSYSVAHSVVAGAVSWDAAVVIAEEVAGSSTSTIVPLMSGTYFVRAKDSGGQLSLPAIFDSTGASLTSLSIVATVTEEPTFAGTHYQTAAAEGVLKIESAANMDSITASIDAWEWFDAMEDAYQTGAGPQYNFANKLDLTTKQVVRLRSHLISYTDSFRDLIDDRSEDMDTWTDFDAVNTGVTNARMQMRKTDDDPDSGAATWGSWGDFYVSEEEARGFDFRVFLETSDPIYTLNISTLRVYAEQLAS